VKESDVAGISMPGETMAPDLGFEAALSRLAPEGDNGSEAESGR
jgi:hypothetical protein